LTITQRLTKTDIPNILVYNQPETTQAVANVADARRLVKRDDASTSAQMVDTSSATVSTIAPYVTGSNATSPQAQILAVAAAAPPSASTSAEPEAPKPDVAAASSNYKAGKRGLCYNLANLTHPFGPKPKTDSQVTWAYNWYNAPGADFNEKLDYIPLLYNNAPASTGPWAAAADAAIKRGSTALFSFNEPDACYSGSACMTVDAVVKAYKKHMNPFKGKALLGAPAVTNAGAPYGLTYLQKFLKDCPKCHVDFINVHWYSNKYAGATYFEEFMTSVKEVAGGRPVWVTEYGLTDDNPYTEQELVEFLKTTMSWMDQQPWIARYSYFMDAPGVLMSPNGKKKSKAGVAFDTFVNKTQQAYLG